MSFVALEQPGRGFPTTVGFKTTSGFNVPPTASNGSPLQQPLRPFAASQPATPATVVTTPVAAGPKSQLDFSPASSSFKSEQPGLSVLLPPRQLSLVLEDVPETPSPGPEADSNVGWRGLLEISQNSGCSGVLGSRTTSDEMDNLLNNDSKIEICCTAHTSPAIRRLVKSVIRGLRACQEPDKATDGMGGTYFFSNEAGRKAAILKPCDEEALAPNNPKGYVGRQLGDPGWKPTVRVGEAAMREVAAYLLDHDGFARVPTSVLVRARHPIFCYNAYKQSGAVAAGGLAGARRASYLDLVRDEAAPSGAEAAAAAVPDGLPPLALLPMKLGSLQEFVVHECDTSEMGPSRFSARDVHRIGILDLRLFNTDRHAGNMLVRTPRSTAASTADLRRSIVSPDAQYELIPIDHGFCLPETLEAPYFEWLHWPQTMLPFSEDELQYIQELNVERDKSILRTELPNLRPECLRVLEVSTMLLKLCAAEGLTLHDIASVMTRPFENAEEEPSELERICAYARQCVEYAQAMDPCGVDLKEEEDGDCCDSVSEASYAMDGEALQGAGSSTIIIAVPGVVDAAATVGSVGRRSREGDSMVFDLEEDADNLYIKAKLSPELLGLVAPDGSEGSSQYSPGSSLSTEDDPMSMHHMGSLMSSSLTRGSLSDARPVLPASAVTGGLGDLLAAGDGAAATTEERTPQAPERAAPFARSLHVTDGFSMYRKLQTQQQAAKRAATGQSRAMYTGRARRRCGFATQPYPPPSAAFSQERMNKCFSGMDEEQWAEFMAVFTAQVSSALRQGHWRQAAADKNGGIAMSCPRF